MIEYTNQTIVGLGSLDDATLVDCTINAIINHSIYRNCTFERCTFSTDYMDYLDFDECTFINCDFRAVKSINSIDFDKSRFTDCKFPENIPTVKRIESKLYDTITSENLDMGDWHSECGTTHCIAGWIVTLAKMENEENIDPIAVLGLEYDYSTPGLASFIYAKSSRSGVIPDFFTDDNSAMAGLEMEYNNAYTLSLED